MNIESLLNFIFDNFFLVLVIGGIYSFLKRLGEEGKKQERPPIQRQRDYDDRPDPSHSGMDTRRSEQQQEHRQEYQSSAEQPYQTSENDLLQQYRDLRQKKEDIGNSRGHQPLKPLRPKKQAMIHNHSHVGHVNKKRAAEGVVWAEILSPPRSKRPINPRMKR